MNYTKEQIFTEDIGEVEKMIEALEKKVKEKLPLVYYRRFPRQTLDRWIAELEFLTRRRLKLKNG